MPEPVVDVLIPVFNAAATVRSALESIQNQTLETIRVIVVDDGSTDGTGPILADIARSDPRVDHLTQPNCGVVDALNRGLRRCTAPYVARFDGDDIAYPERLAMQVSYLERHPRCAAVSGRVHVIDEGGRQGELLTPPPIPLEASLTTVPALEPKLTHPFLMMRRNPVQSLGGYRPLFHSEDVDLYWRLQELGELRNTGDILGAYRIHSGSVSARSLVNARIQALTSQLAVISAVRRRRGDRDLEFRRDALAAYEKAVALEGMLKAARSLGLNEAESGYLEVAAPMKLLEGSAFRSYEPEVEDCRLLRAAISRHAAWLGPANLEHLNAQCSRAAARLITRGMFNRALALVEPDQYPSTMARAGKYLVRGKGKGFG